MLVLVGIVVHAVSFGDQFEQQANTVLRSALLIAQEVPEVVRLQGFLQLVPFVGDS